MGRLGIARGVPDWSRLAGLSNRLGRMMSDFDRKTHWEKAWADRPDERLSWHQPHPACSLEMIRHAGVGTAEPVIDVGGGTSRLVDSLLEAGYQDLTVLDLSATALHRARQRLGNRAGRVQWIESDITLFEASGHYALWHDRAVFHFLVDRGDRARYVEALDRALSPAGQAVIATFARGGPKRCSGLPIVQYDANRLCAELGQRWRLVEERLEFHTTPAGKEQKFAYFRIQRNHDAAAAALQSPSKGHAKKHERNE